MSSTLHAPGPWKPEWMEGSHCFGIRSQDGTVAYTRQTGKLFGPIHRQHKANACLIGAAPDLLAVMKSLLAEISDAGTPSKASIASAQVVIAKAEGLL